MCKYIRRYQTYIQTIYIHTHLSSVAVRAIVQAEDERAQAQAQEASDADEHRYVEERVSEGVAVHVDMCMLRYARIHPKIPSLYTDSRRGSKARSIIHSVTHRS